MDRDALSGTMLDGRYLFGEIVAEREHTNVYAADDLRTGASLAIEVLRDGLGASSLPARELRRRAMLACRVRHPNAVMPRDVGSLPDQTSFIVQKRLDGRTLEERIRVDGAMPAQEVVRIGVQVLSALAAAHDAGVVHGALGPDSIFLAAREGVVLSALVSGFGSTRAIDAETPLGYLALAFRAPELNGTEPPSAAADVYALAAVLHLASAGYPPYSAPSRRSLADTVRDVSAHVPELAVRLARVLTKALSRDPRVRYATADDMLRALLRARDRNAALRRDLYEQDAVPTVRGHHGPDLSDGTERGSGVVRTRRAPERRSA